MNMLISDAIESMETEKTQINEKLGEDGEVDEGTTAKLGQFKLLDLDHHFRNSIKSNWPKLSFARFWPDAQG